MSRTLSVLALLAVTTTAAHAQFPRKNVELLGRFHPSRSYNDVWGYRNPANGKEYALLGTTTGLYVVDVTDPKNPAQRGFIAATQSPGWRSCTTRDVKVYKQFAYVTTDCGAGMQIIDLRNPDQPKLLKTWGAQYWRGAHNIAMDTERGVAWPCGSIGAIAVDVATDPQNPRFLVRIGNYGYIHDLAIQSGIAHFCAIFGRTYYLIDVKNLPTFRVIGSRRDSGSIFCHAAWPSRDDKICVTTNERGNGPTGIYDISTPSSPRLVATWHTGGSSTVPHNVIVRDRVAHLSYYIAGGRFLDVSTPSKPVEVGYLDTSTATRGFSGAWGVYVQPESGITYISDRSLGLFILKASASASYYGTAAAGTGNKTPRLAAFGSAFAGNAAHKLEILGAKATTPALLGLSLGKSSFQVNGLPVNLDLTKLFAILLVTTDASGNASIPIPIPATLGAVKLYGQAFALDNAGPNGFSATKGMEFETFRN